LICVILFQLGRSHYNEIWGHSPTIQREITNTHIYIYMCVCVCVCVLPTKKRTTNNKLVLKKKMTHSQGSQWGKHWHQQWQSERWYSSFSPKMFL
jgi:hypothetical protein